MTKKNKWNDRYIIYAGKTGLVLVLLGCLGFCTGSSRLLVTAVDIFRTTHGLEENLQRTSAKVPTDDSFTIDVTSTYKSHGDVIQHPKSNRTLIWRNYTTTTGYADEINPQFLEEISLVWLLADPPTPRAHQIMAIIYILMMVIGFLGNAFVLVMFLKFRTLRTPANTFVMNLAASDWMMMTKIPIVVYNSFRNGPALGALGCQTYGFVGALSGTVSITTLTVIAIDRFNVIVYPLNPNRCTTFWKARFMILFCWLYSLFFSAIPLFGFFHTSYVPEGYLTCCSFDYLSNDADARWFMFCYFIFAWCVPFLTIAYCYSHILYVVVSANSIQSSKDKNKQELKLAAVVFSVIALWFLAWTPYAVVALIGISHNEHLLSPLGSMLPAFFAKGAACINPYVYAVTHPRFRGQCRQIFFKSGARPTNFTASGKPCVMETNVDGRRQRVMSIDVSIDETVIE